MQNEVVLKFMVQEWLGPQLRKVILHELVYMGIISQYGSGE
jgi:hypothetical protein